MKALSEILNRPRKPFNIKDFGGLQDDEYIKDEVIYCKKCNTPRLFVNDTFRVRCLCDCQGQARDNEEKARKERERLKEIEKIQSASLIGDRYKGVTFEKTETGHNATFDNAFIRCQKYCKAADKVLADGLGIYLYGDKGTGKTHLTACMANDLMQNRKQVLFTNFAEIAKMIKGTFGSTTESEAAYINRIATVDFLFIDDLGTERVQATNGADLWLQEKIFEILNKRYNNRLPTIFTSNYSLQELITERGIMDKTVDRIVEMASAIINVKGKSYRLDARAKVELPF
jgi:DNA replication protein DnaC